MTFTTLGCDQEDKDERAAAPRPAPEAPAVITPKPDDEATGPVFEDPDFKLEVHPPSLCKSTAPFVPKPGSQRLSIPLSVQAKSDRVVPISPMSFSVEDEDGNRYGATLAGCSPTFSNETLTAGETRKGEVAFDVPKDAGALELVYEPFLIGRKRVLARVEVPALEKTSTPADEQAAR